MNKKTRIIFFITGFMVLVFNISCYAVTDAEVQAAVDSSGKEAVSGNLFIWFLCALAFMKVSQKIDSFMKSLGVSVGRTGGSMLAETMLVGKAVGSAFKGGGKFAGFGKSIGTGAAGGSAPAGKAGFFGGIGRKMADGAMGSVTGNASGGMMASIGKKMYENSVGKGGAFATSVIGSVARGDINKMGTISGSNGKMAMESYFGYNANVEQSSSVTSNSVGYDSNGEAIGGGFSETGNMGDSIPAFSDIEMGGGRITGTETSSEYPNGIQFAMYDAEKYAKPEGNFETVTAVDNSKWYKQYAAPTVEKSPYMDAGGKVQYNEKIVERIPKAPPRRDRM